MVWIFLGFTVLPIALFVVEQLIGAPHYSENQSNHFDGKKFVNPGELNGHHYLDVLKWWFSGNEKGPWYTFTEKDFPNNPKPDERVSGEDLKVTFVNHSTFLLQMEGQNILTDPIWSDRASPYQWIGPKRMRPPGIRFKDLPSIDTVLISHNHYDHLDLQTVKDLQRVHDPLFVVPLGVEQFLHDQGISRTVRLDWWDYHQLDDQFSLTAVPARHFSGRGLFDRNKTLWCGYVLHTPLGNIYFAGDSGYGDFFEKIGEKFGPMHASFIPIGAYKPRWFMAPIHISPEEALQVHQDVNSEQSFAMHFGTFPMADDGMKDPKIDLTAARKELRIPKADFIIPKEGQTEIVKKEAVKA
ncbi:MBL fold metallo-hydrolase [Fodinibius salsisoli]|uniref:MBL fold metallo-hydrolase n=1 Tax=Fodinibius salsisoli TaxID=2820877 RepID=A0ABT3PI60_9BACT|nr:MBL fold metallo-hydrolase [Fodinibius salsisoli]MCW9705478.1 MBL fold metallo-hydrolase [Fodinibius salsisoli]